MTTKTLFTLTLATFFVSCGNKIKIPLDFSQSEGNKLTYEAFEATDRMAKTKNRANQLTKEARERFWPESPKLARLLELNKEMSDCVKQTILPDDFFAEMHRSDRLAPDSHFIETMNRAYHAEADCYESHNKQMTALLEGEL